MEERTSGQLEAGGLQAGWATDAGRRGHGNEDACVALPEDGLFVVSDGMGGEQAGEVAASLVVEKAPRLIAEHVGRLQDPDRARLEAALRDAVLELNHQIREESSQMTGVRRMGATVVMALVRDDAVHVANMGDSMAYLVRRDDVETLSRDHSVAGLLERRGALTAEEAAHHPMRARLSRYVGMGGNAEPHVCTTSFPPGNVLLLCTDGLTSVIGEEKIGEIVRGEASVERVCNALVDAALKADSEDNVTVLVVRPAES